MSGSGTLDPVFSGPALTAPARASTWRRSRCGRIACSLARARALVLDPGDPGRRRQPDGDGHRLLVIEQQRRQFGPDAESVMPIPTAYRVHGVVEPAQPVDVVAYRPGADLEPSGELGAGPDRTRLEQAEQSQQSC
jgi:hypothetical protein